MLAHWYYGRSSDGIDSSLSVDILKPFIFHDVKHLSIINDDISYAGK